MMNTELFHKIARELGIARPGGELVNSWYARVLYSSVGRMALASLWDVEEGKEDGETSISLTHFKRKIINLFCSWFSLYPEIVGYFQKKGENSFIEKEELVSDFTQYEDSWQNWPSKHLGIARFWADQIYSTYLHTGFFYHSAYRLSPPAKCYTCEEYIRLVRGLPLNQLPQMSGLGTYQTGLFRAKTLENSLDIFSMFHLQKQPLKDYWEFVVNRFPLTPGSIPEEASFLRTNPPFQKGYWLNLPEKEQISLMKSNHVYYLYLLEKDGTFLCAPLPDWLGLKGEYRRLALGLLAQKGKLPVILFKKRGPLVHITQKYLLPPSELEFLKVYSWPAFLEGASDFRADMDTRVFNMLRGTFEKIGYQFKEEE